MKHLAVIDDPAPYVLPYTEITPEQIAAFHADRTAAKVCDPKGYFPVSYVEKIVSLYVEDYLCFDEVPDPEVFVRMFAPGRPVYDPILRRCLPPEMQSRWYLWVRDCRDYTRAGS